MSDTSDELDAILEQLGGRTTELILSSVIDKISHAEEMEDVWYEAKQQLIHWKNQAIRAEMLSMIGEHETEYSNLDGDAGYWEKHGRNQFRDKLRQQVISRYGAEDGDTNDHKQ